MFTVVFEWLIAIAPISSLVVSWHYWYCSSCYCYYWASLYFFSPKVLSSSSLVVSWHYALAHCHKSLPALPLLPRCQDPRTYLQHISKRRWSNFHDTLKSIEYLFSWRSFWLRARAVTGRRCPHSGVGEDFLERRPGSPHENGRNSGTKSRKLDTLVPKRSQRRGLRTPLWQKTGSHTKKRIFGPKSGFFGPKKNTHFLGLTMF